MMEIIERDDYEYCDRCEKRLNKLMNEDIYLEKVSLVVCDECHTDEDRKYW